jgi:hypothetical protein
MSVGVALVVLSCGAELELFPPTRSFTRTAKRVFGVGSRPERDI